MDDPDDTRPKDLLRAVEIGRHAGLRYVYAGNLPGMVGDHENTSCHHCGDTLIKRRSYFIEEYRLTPDGRCPSCKTAIPGRWAPEVRRADYRSSFLAASGLGFGYNPQLGSRTKLHAETAKRARPGTLAHRSRLLASRLSYPAPRRGSDCRFGRVQEHAAVLAAHRRHFEQRLHLARIPGIATPWLDHRRIQPLPAGRYSSALLGGCADSDRSGNVSRPDTRRRGRMPDTSACRWPADS